MIFTNRSDSVQSDPSIYNAAEIYDYVYYNTTTTMGTTTFLACAERLGPKNDGSAYADFYDLDQDGKLEWFDVSFNYVGFPWLPTPQGVAIHRRSFATPCQGLGPHTVSTNPGLANLPVVVLSSTSGSSPGTWLDAAYVPLNFDELTWGILGDPNALSERVNVLDEAGNASLQLTQQGDPAFSGLTVTSVALVEDESGIVFVTDSADVVYE